MIYLTGDTHGGIDLDKLTESRLEEKGIFIGEGDHLIVTGDFGFPFLPADIIEYEATNGTKGEYSILMTLLRRKPYKILFVDGNHDNHEWWAEQPVSEMFGGRVQVHPHAENIIHLMRGEMYNIEGKTFFTFGGAASIDKAYRTEHISWWAGEETNAAETEHALETLEKAGNKADYIITHTLPSSIVSMLPCIIGKPIPCSVSSFLEQVLYLTEYKRWYCGHFHTDTYLPGQRMRILYNDVIPLDED